MSDADDTPIVVRRRPRRKHGHHGGAWKVAYADFVTAMMAFFLVMWLIGVGTKQQRAAISEYFKNPSMAQGTATVAPPGKMGPGGASDSAIQLGGALDLPHGPGMDRHGAAPTKVDSKEVEKQARQQERARLEDLMQQLHAAIQNSQALAPFKDQLLLDITPEGLRIQIVDKQNRPMFDLGSATLKSYTETILHELAGFINRVPNKISISGHTDDAPYSSDHHYGNWELSADRANAARRALLAGGLRSDKIARVVGLAASVPFDKVHPGDPINRRISIIVMTKQAEDAAFSQEVADNGGKVIVPGVSTSAPAAAPVPVSAAATHATLPAPAVILSADPAILGGPAPKVQASAPQ